MEGKRNMTFYQYPDYMYHHGVKGMKWGVRKEYQSSVYGKIPQRNVSRKKTWSTKTKNGETVTLRRRRVNPLRRANMRRKGEDWQAYNAYNSKGKKNWKDGTRS